MTLEDLKGLLEKATPGPWKLNRHGYPAVYSPHEFVKNANGTPICGIWDPEGNHEQAANAALLAAAPELAALLVRAVEETRATTAELDRLCSVISDEDIAIVEPVVDSARSFLRELGVEA